MQISSRFRRYTGLGSLSGGGGVVMFPQKTPSTVGFLSMEAGMQSEHFRVSISADLVGWLVGGSVGWLVGGSVCWLINRLIGCSRNCLTGD